MRRCCRRWTRERVKQSEEGEGEELRLGNWKGNAPAGEWLLLKYLFDLYCSVETALASGKSGPPIKKDNATREATNHYQVRRESSSIYYRPFLATIANTQAWDRARWKLLNSKDPSNTVALTDCQIGLTFLSPSYPKLGTYFRVASFP